MAEPAGERTLLTLLAASGRPWRDVAGRVALVVVTGHLVWRALLLDRGYFSQGDFVLLTLGGQPLSLDLLTSDYSGHLLPGGLLVAWLTTHLAPLGWGLAVVETLALQLLASVLAWLVLTRLLPGSWWRLPVLSAYLFCPLALWPTQSWAVAVSYLPVSLFLLLATWAMLHRIQEASRWSGALVVLATLAGLLFGERAVLYPVVLAFVAIFFAETVGLRRVLTAARAHLVVWVPMVVVLATYVAVHRDLAPTAGTTPGAGALSARLVGDFVARNAVPGLVGGPWADPGPLPFVVPGTWAVVLAWAVMAALLVTTLRRSRSAVWGWLLLLAYTLLDIALLLVVGTAPDVGAALGLVPRHAADIVPVLPVALGLVVRAATAGPVTVRPRTREAVPALLLAVAYLASGAVSTAAIAPHAFNREARAYVESLRAGLRADPRAVLYDGPVPDTVMGSWFGEAARVSTVVATAPEDPVFDVPAYDLRMVDPAGTLRPIDLVAAVSDRPTSDVDCVHPVTSGGITRVLLDATSGAGKQVARIGYYTAASGFLTVAAAGIEAELALRTNLNVADVVVRGPISELDLGLEPAAGEPAGGTVCVVSVDVGYATPED